MKLYSFVILNHTILYTVYLVVSIGFKNEKGTQGNRPKGHSSDCLRFYDVLRGITATAWGIDGNCLRCLRLKFTLAIDQFSERTLFDRTQTCTSQTHPTCLNIKIVEVNSSMQLHGKDRTICR